MASWSYLFRTALDRIVNRDASCPHCRSGRTSLIGRKFIILQLRRCSDCGLMFRFPKEGVQHNFLFYQRRYKETGLTSEFPDDTKLCKLVETSFIHSDRDFSKKISIIKKYKLNGRLLDYGCSWGYGLHQFRKAGYDALGYEISRIRSEYGRTKLGVSIVTSAEDLLGQKFDVIFVNHVLEHLPNLYTIFYEFSGLMKSDCLLLIFVPNCTGMCDAAVFEEKRKYAFGEKHTLALDRVFFEKNLQKYGMDGSVSTDCNEGEFNIHSTELMILARKRV